MNSSSNLSGDAYFYNERNTYHSYQNEYQLQKKRGLSSYLLKYNIVGLNLIKFHSTITVYVNINFKSERLKEYHAKQSRNQEARLFILFIRCVYKYNCI